VLTLQNLGTESKRIAVRPLTQYALAVNFWNNRLAQAINKPENWARRNTVPIKGDFMGAEFYSNYLARFNTRFREWLTEMAQNNRALQAFNIDTPLLHTIINGYVPKEKSFWGGENPQELGYDDYNFDLNAEESKLPALEVEKRFMAIFYKSTVRLFDSRFKPLIG